MKIKPRIVTLAFLTVIAALSAAAALSTPKDSPSVGETDAEALAQYYLRDCDGYIAVYRGASLTPAEVTEIETGTLNDTDIAKLREGIPAESRNELLMLLEDLGS